MKNKRVMVVAAHPDDADFYCGGTVALWAEQGAEITYLICTDGALGSDDKEMKKSELKKLRFEEQNNANTKLGVKETVYLNYPDMGLPMGEEVREKIAKEYRRRQPQIVLTFDPWLRYELHPDHTSAGTEAIYARMAAKLPMKYSHHLDEGLDVCSIEELYLFKTDMPDTWIETESVIEKKFAALECHYSQFGPLVQDGQSGMEILKEMSHRHPETGRIAEGFRRLVLGGMEGIKTYIRL